MAGTEDPFTSWVSSLLSTIEAGQHLVIVEGANDKKSFARCFQSHPQHGNHQAVFAFFPRPVDDTQVNNKRLVFRAIRKLKQLAPNSRHVLGIVDADFMRARVESGELHRSQYFWNLFYTDAHDLDCQIFQSKALDGFAAACFSGYENGAQDLRGQCLQLATNFGYFKCSLQINKLHRLRERFRDITEFINPCFEIDEGLVHDAVDACVAGGVMTADEATQFFATVGELKAREIDPWQLADGHDLFRVLGLLIIIGKIPLQDKKLLRYKKKKDLLVDADARKNFTKRLEHRVRQYYDAGCFKETELYQKICKYQRRSHVGFIEDSADLLESIAYITRGAMFPYLPARTIGKERPALQYKNEKKGQSPEIAEGAIPVSLLKDWTRLPKRGRDYVEVILPSVQKKKKKKKKKKGQDAVEKISTDAFKRALPGIILSNDAVVQQFFKDLTRLSLLSNEKDIPHFCATAKQICFTQFQGERANPATLTPDAERRLVLLLFSLASLLAWMSQKKFQISTVIYKSWMQTNVIQDRAPAPSGDEARHLAMIIYRHVHVIHTRH